MFHVCIDEMFNKILLLLDKWDFTVRKYLQISFYITVGAGRYTRTYSITKTYVNINYSDLSYTVYCITKSGKFFHQCKLFVR
jgi:hypothetical protein